MLRAVEEREGGHPSALALWILGVFLSLAVLACTGVGPGRAALKAGRLDDAREHAFLALLRQADNWDAYLLVAEIALAEESYEEAVRAAELADRYSGGREEVLVVLQEALWRGEQWGGYCQVVERRYGRDPGVFGRLGGDGAALLQAAGWAAHEVGQSGGAMSCYRVLQGALGAAFAGEYVDSYTQVAESFVGLLLISGRYYDAITLIEGLDALRPQDRMIRAVEVGRLHLQLRDSDRANASFGRYVAAVPEGPERWQRMERVSQVLESSGRAPEALRSWQGVLAEVAPVEGRHYVRLFHLALKAFEAEVAQGALTALLDPGRALAVDEVLAVGRLAADGGWSDWALVAYRAGLARFGGEEEVVFAMATLLHRRGEDVDEAFATAWPHLSAPGVKGGQIGDWLFQRGYDELALHYYQRARVAPDAPPDLDLRLALVLRERRRYDEMERALSEYIRRAGEGDAGLTARVQAARVAREARSWNRVVAWLREVYQERPQDTEVVWALAEAYEAQRLPQEAARVREQWASASAAPQEAYMRLLQDAMSRQDEARVEQYLAVLTASPASAAAAWYAVGVFYYASGRDDKSLEAFASFVAAAADPRAARERLIVYYLDEVFERSRALALMQAFLEDYPDAVEMRYRLGRTALVMGDEAQAVEAFVAYVEGKALAFSALMSAVQEGGRLNRPAFALTLVETLQQRHPASLSVQEALGEVLWSAHQGARQGDPAQGEVLRQAAVAVFERVVGAGTSGEELLNLANRLMSRELVPLAVRAFDQAGVEAIAAARLMRTYGEALLLVGRHAEGVAALDAYVRQGGSAPALRLEVARVLLTTEAAGSAEGWLRALVDGERGTVALQAYQVLSDLLVISGRASEIKALTTAALKRTAMPFELMGAAARAYSRAGLVAEAVETYRRMLAQRPAAISVAVDLAILAMVYGDEGEAVQVLDQVISRSETPGLVLAAVAAVYDERGELERALDAYRRAVELSPLDDPQVLHRLAVLEVQGGQVAAGLEAFARAVAAGGGDEGATLTLANALWRRGEEAAADELARSGARRLLRSGPLHLFRIEAAFRRGEAVRALLWADDYRIEGYARDLLQQVLASAGAYDALEEVIESSVTHHFYDAAALQLIRHQGISLQVSGGDFFVPFALRVARLLPAPGRLLRNIAALEMARGREAEALALLRGLASDQRLEEDQLTIAALLVGQGMDDEALAWLATWIEGAGQTGREERYRRAVDRLLLVHEPELAVAMLAAAIAAGHWEVAPDWVELLALGGDVDGAFAVLRQEPLAAVFRGEGGDAQVRQVMGILQRLRVLGFRQESEALVASLAQHYPQRLDVVLMRLEAAGSGAALLQARDAALEIFKDDAARVAILGAWLRQAEEVRVQEIAPVLAALSLSYQREILGMSLTKMSAKERTRLVTELVASHFDQVRVRLSVAAALDRVGAFAEAAHWYEQSLALMPAEATAYEMLAQSLYLAGDDAGALAALEQSTRRRQGRVSAWLAAAELYAVGPDSGLAVAALRQALPFAPADRALRLALARQQLLAGMAADGKVLLDEVLGDAPALVDLEGALRALLEAGEVESALALVQRHETRLSQGAEASWLAGVTLLRSGDADEAVRHFSAASQVSLSPLVVDMAVAETFRRRGEMARAEQFIARAMDSRPRSPAPYLYRGLFRLMSGDRDGARMDFALVLASGYATRSALEVMGGAWLLAGAWEEAEDSYGRLLRLSDEGGAAASLAHVAKAYAAVDRAAEALAVVQRQRPGLFDVCARDPALGQAMVEALIAGGEAERAWAMAESSVQRHPARAEAWAGHAAAAAATARASEATRSARWALYLSEAGARWRYLAILAEVHGAQSQWAEAESLALTALRQGGGDAAWRAGIYGRLAFFAESQGATARAQGYVKQGAQAQALVDSPLTLYATP